MEAGATDSKPRMAGGARIAAALSLIAAATAMLVCASLADAHDVRYPTSSSFGYAPGTTVLPDAFLGQVSSPQADCVTRRKAVVFRKRGGRDARVGSDRTSTTGQWIVERAHVRSGRYYLKVPKRQIGGGSHDHLCRPYRSPTLRFGG